MSDETQSQPEPVLSEVLAAYLEAADEGRAPDPDELLARYPQLADELRAFLAADGRMAASFRGPPAGASGETITHAPDPTLASPEQPEQGSAFGAYDLLELLGEGGMGVVYRARHRELRRVVALKLIHPGRLGSPTDRERFRIEARAAARLSDEGIVRLYEVGEHEGSPFIASEFCAGGSLDKKLRKRPAPARDAARTVAGLAAAVQKAHDAGIVHRDLKPANVLIDADGRYKVGDFGLAKLLDETAEVSVSNAIMGSPPYMSPEQAEGRGRAVTGSSDVYSLGAILYEMLTGRPPFTGATPTDILRQVVRDEPDPPRRLNRAVPRDLQTVCLRCLEKNPARRFATARDLADELGRYLRGEPILSRPVGPLGRVRKWCGRNPVPSVAAAVVLATAGTAIALIADSRDRAVQLAGEKGKLVDAMRVLLVEKGKLAEDMTRLAEHNGRLANDLQGALASALLAPVSATDPKAALTPYEVNAFWQLAARRGTSVGTLFLEQALRTPAACEQLACRAEFALHAAIGLDPAARGRVDVLFRDRLVDPNTSPDQRMMLALVVAQWEPASRETAAFAAAQVTEAIAADPNPKTIRARVAGLIKLADRLDPAVTAAHLDRVAVLVANEYSKTNTGDAALRGEQALALRLVTERMGAERAVDILSERVAQTGSPLMPVFTAAVARLEPGRRSAAAARAAERLVNSTVAVFNPPPDTFPPGKAPKLPPRPPENLSGVALSPAAWTLRDLVAHMEPGAAVALLSGAVAKMPESRSRWEFRRVMASVAKRMEPDAGAELLVKMMSETTDPLSLHGLATDVSEVVARMKPEAAAAAGGKALEILIRAIDEPVPAPAKSMVLDLLAGGVKELTAALPPVQAAVAEARVSAACDRAVESLVATITKDPTRFFDYGGLERALLALAPRAEPTRTAELIVAGIEKMKNDSALALLAAGLAAVAPRLKPEQADVLLDRAAKVLTDAIASGAYQLPHVLGRGVGELARRMQPEKGTALVTNTLKVGSRLGLSTDALRWFTEALGAGPLDNPKEPAEARELAARVLDELLATTAPNEARLRIADRFKAALDRTDPDEAAELLLAAMPRAQERYLLSGFAWNVSEVAARMKPDKAAAACAKAAGIVTESMTRNANEYQSMPYATGLKNLAPRMEPAAAAAALTGAMGRISAPDASRELLVSLNGVAPRLTPEQAAAGYEAAAAAFSRALTRPENRTVAPAKAFLARLIADAARQLPPEKAAAVCDPVAKLLAEDAANPANSQELSYLMRGLEPLVPLMTPDVAAGLLLRQIARTSNTSTLGTLAQLLATVAGRMEPEKAAQACESAAKTLRDAMATAKPTEQKALSAGLAALGERREPKKAAAVGDETKRLIETMTTTSDPTTLAHLGESVAAVAARMKPAERFALCEQAAKILADAMARTTDTFQLTHLAGGLAAVTGGMEPGRASVVAFRGARLFADALLLTKRPAQQPSKPMTAALSSLAARMDPGEAVELLSEVWTKLGITNPRELTAGLSAVAARAGPEAATAILMGTMAADPAGVRGHFRLLNDIDGFSLTTHRPSSSPALAVAGTGGLVVGKAYLPVPAKRLSPQALVDLLKHPFCVGDARRAVLDQLGAAYERRFADQWEFAEYARNHQPHLDLAKPPDRPGR